MRCLVALALTALLVGCGGSSGSGGAQNVRVTTVASGLDIPWGLVRLSDGSLLVSERPGRLSQLQNGKRTELDPPPGIGPNHAGTQLLDLKLIGDSLRVTAVAQNQDLVLFSRPWPSGTWQERVRIPSAGQSDHFGGRMLPLPDGRILLTTGERRVPALARDPASPWGKTLIVPPDSAGAYSVYSRGHRNSLGLALDPAGNIWSSEHGPSDFDLPGGRDEVNLITENGDYGWPESVGDTVQRGTVAPAWHSGAPPALAPGDALIPKAGPWAGRLLVPGLNGKRLTIFRLDAANNRATPGGEILVGTYGRLRTIIEEPGGSLLVTTSNGNGKDVILRVSAAR